MVTMKLFRVYINCSSIAILKLFHTLVCVNDVL